MVLSPAASANLKTSRARSKTCRPPAKRFTSQAPASASVVLPTPIPRDVAMDPAVVTFTTKAPSRIAGHKR